MLKNNLTVHFQNLKTAGWAQWLFMVVGILFVIGATDKWDLFLGFAGVFLFAKGFFNWGCNGQCSIPNR